MLGQDEAGMENYRGRREVREFMVVPPSLACWYLMVEVERRAGLSTTRQVPSHNDHGIDVVVAEPERM